MIRKIGLLFSRRSISCSGFLYFFHKLALRMTPSVSSPKVSKSITTALASAFLEWLLIFFLYIDAIFSYLITKFARYCGLQVPCILCSRLDRVLGNEEGDIYKELICGKHKLEISSLVLCHIHDKLINVHGMCESCLFSFATINKSNAETYRLLVGKLGPDPHQGIDLDPLLQEHNLGSSGKRNCSCCNEEHVFGGHAQKLLETKSIGSEAAELDVPLSPSHTRKRGIDPLSHIEYTKVKINSDTESEVQFSDDDNEDSALIRETDGLKEDFAVECVDIEPRTVFIGDDLTSEILIDPASAPEPSLTELEVEVNTVDLQVDYKTEPTFALELMSFDEVPRSSDAMDTAAEISIETSDAAATAEVRQNFVIESEELNSQPNEDKSDPYPISELISFDEVPPSFNVMDSWVEVSMETLDAHATGEVGQKIATGSEVQLNTELNCQQVEYKSEPSAIYELISFDEVPTSSSVMDTSVDVPIETLEAPATIETEQKIVSENGDISNVGSVPITPSETNIELNSVSNNTTLQIPNYLELGDAYKLAVRGRQLSGKFSEQRSMKDSTRITEDLKLLFSQLSGTSPRLSGNNDELSSNSGIQILQRRISLERNESGLSLDGSIVSEIEGESVCDRLNRQIEHDKKLMGSLYKELEEERNASTVAVNQAMAMITRLQEEKAALQMEALQCLRMMEEQAEYDMEDLQRANELLSEKEKEIQDLEVELELYRKKYGDISTIDSALS